MAHKLKGLTQERLLKDYLQRSRQASEKPRVAHSLLPSLGLKVQWGSTSLNLIRTVAVGAPAVGSVAFHKGI